jgi:hypothetical protein
VIDRFLDGSVSPQFATRWQLQFRDPRPGADAGKRAAVDEPIPLSSAAAKRPLWPIAQSLCFSGRPGACVPYAWGTQGWIPLPRQLDSPIAFPEDGIRAQGKAVGTKTPPTALLFWPRPDPAECLYFENERADAPPPSCSAMMTREGLRSISDAFADIPGLFPGLQALAAARSAAMDLSCCWSSANPSGGAFGDMTSFIA